MADPLIDTLFALTGLLEAESEALAQRQGPDTLGTLAVARARLLADLRRASARYQGTPLAAAIGALQDAAAVHAAVICDVTKKNWPAPPKDPRCV